MSDAVTCRFVYTTLEFRKATASHFRKTAIILILLFCVIGVMTFTQNNSIPATVVTHTVGVSVLLLFIRWRGIRRFKASSTANRLWTVIISERDVSFSTDIAQSVCKWDAFPQGDIDSSGIRLSPHKLVIHWISASGFASPEDFATACELVKANVKKVKDRRG